MDPDRPYDVVQQESDGKDLYSPASRMRTCFYEVLTLRMREMISGSEERRVGSLFQLMSLGRYCACSPQLGFRAPRLQSTNLGRRERAHAQGV